MGLCTKMSKQGIKHLINSCKTCNKKYIPNYEGDNEQCDYCLAELEFKKDEKYEPNKTAS